ncbi:MAG: ribonuclease HII [Candidatus Omnitrophica bacterium]|nr:ribonuclease HII [Candidatus Omnitrophota bacterium]MBU4488352.1 ribonuclease HII [Candidatus Omnitrophota bacterium]
MSSRRRRPTLLYEKKARAKGHKVIAGVDESGVGPLAGPLVAAAVIIGDFRFKNRIDDSKKLTPKSRLAAYEEIIEKSSYSISVIAEDVIDRLNVYNATRRAMEEAVNNLKTAPDYILIDGTIKLSIAYNGESIKRGDGRSLSIACASILAKVTRDRIMDGLHNRYPQYGFKHNRGYGTAFHFKAIRRYGPSPIHRVTFEPVKSLIKES